MVLIELWGSSRNVCITYTYGEFFAKFFAKFFCPIFLRIISTNFFDEFFNKFFDEFFMNSIASFRIGVSSILFKANFDKL